MCVHSVAWSLPLSVSTLLVVPVRVRAWKTRPPIRPPRPGELPHAASMGRSHEDPRGGGIIGRSLHHTCFARRGALSVHLCLGELRDFLAFPGSVIGGRVDGARLASALPPADPWLLAARWPHTQCCREWPCAEGGHPGGSHAPTFGDTRSRGTAGRRQVGGGCSAGPPCSSNQPGGCAAARPHVRGGSDAGRAAEAHPRCGHVRPLLPCRTGSGLHGAGPPSPAVWAERSPVGAASPPRQGAAAQRTQLCGLASAVPFVEMGVGLGVWDA